MASRRRTLILIVDSDRASRESTSRVLLDAGFDIVEASCDADACAIVHCRRPVLAIFNTDQVSGLALCRHIRADPATEATLTLHIGAQRLPAEHRAAFEDSIDAFLARPFDARELIAAVRALLRVRRIGADAVPKCATADVIDHCLRQIAEHAPDVFWVLEVACDELLYVSPAYRHIWGREPARHAFGSAHWSAGIHPEDTGAVELAYLRLPQCGRFDAEYRIIRPDGIVLWIHERGFALRDAENRVVRLAGVATDVSRRKASEHALRVASRRKDQFLATLAHELRGPLAPIRNAVDIMQRDGDGVAGPLGDARAIIGRQIDHLGRLVEDLLDVSRIGQGKISFRQDVVDLAATLRDALETARPAIEKKGHSLDCHYPAVPLFVRGDAVRLAQIVGNLLANASKYTPEHGHIRVSIGIAGADAIVEISDDGIGIPDDVLPHIFELFMQSDAARERCDGGLGIGLPLAKTLTGLHGGRLDATSAGAGQGASFTLRLPLLTPDGAVTPPARSAMPVGSAAARYRILLVDDSADAAEAMAILLQASGHQVCTVHDGMAALSAAAEFEPEAVILDLGLPHLDGCAVARELRRRPQTANAVLIAVTGYGQPSDRLRTREAGFDRHFVKPVPFETIEAALDAASDFA